jgi:trehalose 6-phosphate phosphatase
VQVFDKSAKFDLRPFFDDLSRAPQSALLADYDGTLAAFQLERDRAFPYSGVSILLTEILNVGHTRVVIITGRPAQEVVPLLGIEPHPEIWGADGLQRLRSDGPCQLPHLDEPATQALAQADTWLDELGLHSLAEHKPGGLAVHWRGFPPDEQADIREIVSRRWLPVADNGRMELQEFEGGLEMSMADGNKGDAVRTILKELSRETLVAYLGDDETDEVAFNAVADRGLRVLVRPEWRKTGADIWLKPPAELLVFLCEWLAACRNAQRPPLATSYSLNRAAWSGE